MVFSFGSNVSPELDAWKVKVDDAVPALIQPVKPKYWFFGATRVKAQTAILLKYLVFRIRLVCHHFQGLPTANAVTNFVGLLPAHCIVQEYFQFRLCCF